jgi:hypothetical protein
MDEQETSKDQNPIDLDTLPQPQLQGHQWQQQGSVLVCRSCPFTHASLIAPGYQLYGIDAEGIPMIRSIKVSDGVR